MCNELPTTPFFMSSLEQLPFQSRVALYGLGEGCYTMLAQLRVVRPDVKVVALLDDKKSTSSAQLPVLSLKQLPPDAYDLILVTSVYWIDICHKLIADGRSNFWVVETPLLFKQITFTDAEVHRWRDKLDQVAALLPESQRALFELIVAARSCQMTHQQALYRHFHACRETAGREYLEFINSGDLHTIIEGGVFDGIDTRAFAQVLAPGGTVYGFDPNLEVFAGHASPAIKLYPMALWHSRAMLSFFTNGDNPMGARVVSERLNRNEVRQVPAISIDEFAAEQSLDRVDLVKLDVEGAELEALEGAVMTLQRCRPQLAICIYHKKEHLFQIPLFLHALLQDYHYYIGHYSPTFWDTVWYAVPREKLVKEGQRDIL